MDRNFVIAIVVSTLVILLYASPWYQQRFGNDIPVVTEQEAPSTPDASSSTRPGSERIAAPEPAASQSPEFGNAPEASLPDELTQLNTAAIETITLDNDVLTLTFSTQGGTLTSAILKPYNGKTEDVPVQLVSDGESWLNGEITDADLSIPLDNLVFETIEQSSKTLVLEALLSGERSIRRTYTLSDTGFSLSTDTRVTGQWDNPALSLFWGGPIRDNEVEFNRLRIWPFSMFMRDDKLLYNKLVFMGEGERVTIESDREKTKNIYSREGTQKIDANKKGIRGEETFYGDLEWYAIRSKYFLSAALPVERDRWSAHAWYENSVDSKWFDLSLTKLFNEGDTALTIYIGPTSYDIIGEYNRDLTQVLELSWRFIRPISIAFLWTIKKLHSVIPNWGLVIIVFSVLIKVLLFPLSKKSFTSMHKMSSLQPEINRLRDKHKNNPQMLHKETMELYKREGVNPMSGCLPTLLQMPVFFALYPVVGRAFELRQAMFIPHWIEDLSRPDPFYILPIAMGISMFFQSRMTMKDPNQKAMLYVMPVMMVILFANFSAGLTLYWFMFNIMTYGQQMLHRS